MTEETHDPMVAVMRAAEAAAKRGWTRTLIVMETTAGSTATIQVGKPQSSEAIRVAVRDWLDEADTGVCESSGDSGGLGPRPTREGGAAYMRDLQDSERKAVVESMGAGFAPGSPRNSRPVEPVDPSSVERLDFTKPPPGLTVFFDDGTPDDDGVALTEGWYYGDDTFDTTPMVWNDGRPLETEAAALTAAWSHYKAHNDPPGLDVNAWGFGQRKAQQPWWRPLFDEPALASVRAAAWSWYETRLALINALDRLAEEAHAVGHDFILAGRLRWPAALALSDADVVAAMTYLDSKGKLSLPDVFTRAEVPEVLRG